MPEDPFAAIDASLMTIRAQLHQAPPPPNKAELEATFDELIGKRDDLVEGIVDAAVRRVAAAAAELEKVVKSARTDPIEIFSAKLAAAKRKVEAA